MGSLTSVRKTWELCFCNVSQALQPDSIPEDLWALRAEPRAGGHRHLNQCMTPSHRPSRGAGALAPHCHAHVTYLHPEEAGCWVPRMRNALPCTNHLLASYFVSASSPTNLFLIPLTLQNLNPKKTHRKAYPKAAS